MHKKGDETIKDFELENHHAFAKFHHGILTFSAIVRSTSFFVANLFTLPSPFLFLARKTGLSLGEESEGEALIGSLSCLGRRRSEEFPRLQEEEEER